MYGSGRSPLSTAAEKRPEIGTVPRSPARLSAREWLDVLKRSFKEFIADDAVGLAQQIAYNSLLAFFPAAIFVLGLLAVVDGYDAVKEFLAPIAPQAVLETIDDIREQTRNESSSVLAFLIGAAGALWVSSSAMNAVVKAVNRAYDRIETRPFWKLRLIAIFLVVATGFATLAMLVLIVFGGPLGEAIADKARLGGAFELLWGIMRWPLAFGAVLIFFAIVYYVAPDTDQRDWRWISPGSLLAGLLWLALSGLFALYTSFSDSYNETYGSIASGVVLLLWLNFSALALLFGAELNSELDREADIRAAGGPNAGLIRPARRTR